MNHSEQHLLTKVFQRDRNLVRLVTYDGILDARIKQVTRYSILRTGYPPLSKIEVLMAFSTANMTLLKPNLRSDPEVQALGLKAVKKIADRKIVDMQVTTGDQCEITLRNGVVINGICTEHSKYNILLDIKGESVLVYKHGIHAFQRHTGM